MIEIYTDTRLAYSKSFIFVMEQFVNTLKAGHSDLSLCINNSMNVTYAVADEEVVGACVYELDPIKRQAWIYTAAVSESHRGQGVYDKIYKEVERVCKENGMVVLNSNVHVDNRAMIQSALKNDREMLWYRTRKYL
jgi:GNAT superfamily N-acetyltransferase